MKPYVFTTISTLFLLSAVETMAAKPVIYPAKGQTAEQQTKDEAECNTWAQQQAGTGAASSTQTTEQPTKKDRSRLKGAAKGAAAGAIIGEVANNEAKEGAAIGAGVGVIAGGRKARKAKEAENQQAKTQQTQQTDAFNRALAACMEGRGYTVK
jgi:uncharacterized protein YcfJ